MKFPLAAIGSILLLAPAMAHAQDGLKLDKAPGQTPALDAFAGLGSPLQLQARWVQIDADALPTALPAWNAAGTSSHVATPDELIALEILKASGTAWVTEQKIKATNNQSANLSFAPFKVFTFNAATPLPPLGPIDDMIIPRGNSRFDAPQSYIPNLAKPESQLPQMAPMPGIGGKYGLPFSAPLLPSAPDVLPQQSTQPSGFLNYKFQLRPTLIGNEIALELRDSNSANAAASTAQVKAGETVVFSIPNVLMALGNGKSRRTFLLVTPRRAPQPERDLRAPAH